MCAPRMKESLTVNGSPTGNDVGRLILKMRVPGSLIVDPLGMETGIFNIVDGDTSHSVEVPRTVTSANLGDGRPPIVSNKPRSTNQYF